MKKKRETIVWCSWTFCHFDVSYSYIWWFKKKYFRYSSKPKSKLQSLSTMECKKCRMRSITRTKIYNEKTPRIFKWKRKTERETQFQMIWWLNTIYFLLMQRQIIMCVCPFRSSRFPRISCALSQLSSRSGPPFFSFISIDLLHRREASERKRRLEFKQI